MSESRITIEFKLHDTSINIEASLSAPAREGLDFCSFVNVDGVVADQRFYGVDMIDCLINAVNFITSISHPPIPILAQRLGIEIEDRLEVNYVYVLN